MAYYRQQLINTTIEFVQIIYKKDVSKTDLMINNNYYKPNITKEWIHKSPFRYSNLFSTYEENAYSYRFPVYRSGGFTTLECEIIIFEQSGNVTLNVFEYGTRDKYASFYCNTYGKNTVLDSVHAKIQSELNKLGFAQMK